MSEMYMEQGRKRASVLYDDPGTIGHSRDYMDGEMDKRESTAAAMSKADAPVFSASQCAICKRGIQQSELVVRGRVHVAHARCVRALVDLINAGRPKEYVQEPDLVGARAAGMAVEKAYREVYARVHGVHGGEYMRKAYLKSFPNTGTTFAEVKAQAEARLREEYSCSELYVYGWHDDTIDVWMDKECRDRNGIP